MTLKVLTVDDSKTIRMIVKKAFRPYDCEILEAENGVEGLAAANKEKPDLIVLDITMPVMNGVEMLEKLKAEPKLQNIPVIMLTAESGKENVLQIVKMGVTDYIVKPFKGEQLIERAQKAVKLETKKEDESGADKSGGYFSADGDIQIITVPEKVDMPVTAKIVNLLETKAKQMSNEGMNKVVLDLNKVGKVDMSLIKLVISVIEKCQGLKTYVRLTGTETLSEGLKDFAETSSLTIYGSVEEAKAAFN